MSIIFPKLKFQGVGTTGITADYWKKHNSAPPLDSGKMIVEIGSDSWNNILDSLINLYCTGVSIDWEAFDAPYHRQKIVLPTYPFQRESYWVKALKAKKNQHLPAEAHPLLGELILSPLEEKLFRNEIDLDFLPYLKDHKVFDRIIFPGAGFVELFHAAGDKLFLGKPFMIKNLLIEQPLTLDSTKSRTVVSQPFQRKKILPHLFIVLKTKLGLFMQKENSLLRNLSQYQI